MAGSRMQAYVAKPPVVVVLKADALQVAPGVTRLRGPDYLNFLASERALALAQGQAETIVQRADAVREDARAKGLVEGRQQARGELLEAVAAVQGTRSQWVKATEPRLVDIVQRCVRDIVKSVNTDSLALDSVHRALAEMTTATDIRIQVHESQVDLLRTKLAELMDKYALRGVMSVEAAMALKPGDCIVESPMGVVDLRVESQLKFVQQTLGST